MHELKFFKSSSDAKTKKGTASARFSRAGTVWNNSVHYAWRYWLPNHTNQRPHCVDYLVNLLMPLSSIAGVNVPGFFFFSHSFSTSFASLCCCIRSLSKLDVVFFTVESVSLLAQSLLRTMMFFAYLTDWDSNFPLSKVHSLPHPILFSFLASSWCEVSLTCPTYLQQHSTAALLNIVAVL